MPCSSAVCCSIFSHAHPHLVPILRPQHTCKFACSLLLAMAHLLLCVLPRPSTSGHLPLHPVTYRCIAGGAVDVMCHYKLCFCDNANAKRLWLCAHHYAHCITMLLAAWRPQVLGGSGKKKRWFDSDLQPTQLGNEPELRATATAEGARHQFKRKR